MPCRLAALVGSPGGAAVPAVRNVSTQGGKDLVA